MRALVLRAACVLALALVVPACSALGLADLPASDCVNGGAGFCDSLGTSNPTFDECLTWQCNRTTRHCEVAARDDDDDDAPSIMCAAGATPDCDDADGMNVPGGVETCDGRDQDCDGIADDGVITVAMAGATISGTSPVVTAQPDSDESYVLARTSMNSFERILLSADGTPATATVQLVGPAGVETFTTSRGTVAAIGSNTYALLVERMTTCRQWVVAPISGSNPNATLRTMDESLLPACPAVGPSAPMASPSIAGRAGAPLLISWLETEQTARTCGDAEAAPLVLGAAELDARGNRVGDATVALGESIDEGRIASLPIAAPAGTGAFLVAYPTMDGAIVVHRITVSATLVIADEGIVYTEPAGAMPRQGVQLALGPTMEGSTTVALSFYEGCGGSNAISVRWLTLSGETLASSGLTTGLGSGLARGDVQVVYQPRTSGWLVSWRSSTGLWAQRLFDDGALEGEPINLVSMAPGINYALDARMVGPMYQATTVDGADVQVLTFGCGE